MSALVPLSGSQQAQELQVWKQAPGSCEPVHLPGHREGSGAGLTRHRPRACPLVENSPALLGSFSGLLECDKPGARLIDIHAQANGGAKVVRIAGPADDLSGAGARHVQGARDILQGRQASVLFLCAVAILHPGFSIPAPKIGSALFLSSMQT